MKSRGAWMALSIITGVLMIVLGILFLARPGMSLASVILLFGWFTIAYGIVEVVNGLLGRSEHRLWTVIVGLLAVVVGIMVLVWPGLTSLALLYLIAAWAIVTGVTDVAGAFASGVSGGMRVWLLLIGIVSIAAGIFLFVNPVTGALAVLWVIGVYLVALGLIRVILGFAPPPPAQPAQ